MQELQDDNFFGSNIDSIDEEALNLTIDEFWDHKTPMKLGENGYVVPV